MFSKQLITYTEKTFKQNKIDILTKTMVKEIKPKSVVVGTPDGQKQEIPFGLLVWAGVCLFVGCTASMKLICIVGQYDASNFQGLDG